MRWPEAGWPTPFRKFLFTALATPLPAEFEILHRPLKTRCLHHRQSDSQAPIALQRSTAIPAAHDIDIDAADVAF